MLHYLIQEEEKKDLKGECFLHQFVIVYVSRAMQ